MAARAARELEKMQIIYGDTMTLVEKRAYAIKRGSITFFKYLLKEEFVNRVEI